MYIWNWLSCVVLRHNLIAGKAFSSKIEIRQHKPSFCPISVQLCLQQAVSSHWKNRQETKTNLRVKTLKLKSANHMICVLKIYIEIILRRARRPISWNTYVPVARSNVLQQNHDSVACKPAIKVSPNNSRYAQLIATNIPNLHELWAAKSLLDDSDPKATPTAADFDVRSSCTACSKIILIRDCKS